MSPPPPILEVARVYTGADVPSGWSDLWIFSIEGGRVVGVVAGKTNFADDHLPRYGGAHQMIDNELVDASASKSK